MSMLVGSCLPLLDGLGPYQGPVVHFFLHVNVNFSVHNHFFQGQFRSVYMHMSQNNRPEPLQNA